MIQGLLKSGKCLFERPSFEYGQPLFNRLIQGLQLCGIHSACQELRPGTFQGLLLPPRVHLGAESICRLGITHVALYQPWVPQESFLVEKGRLAEILTWPGSRCVGITEGGALWELGDLGAAHPRRVENRIPACEDSR